MRHSTDALLCEPVRFSFHVRVCDEPFPVRTTAPHRRGRPGRRVHPNTVRLYEEWGYLSPVPRTPTGYRQFSQMHVEQMRLARLALNGRIRAEGAGARPGAERSGRRPRHGAGGVPVPCARQAERAHAEAAVEFLERWAQGHATDPSVPPLRIQEAARRLSVTPDMLRNWDRNGLLDVPRDPKSGYRMYGAAELGRVRVIRMLRQAGYSLNAILRMLLAFDAGDRANLRRALDTRAPMRTCTAWRIAGSPRRRAGTARAGHHPARAHAGDGTGTHQAPPPAAP